VSVAVDGIDGGEGGLATPEGGLELVLHPVFPGGEPGLPEGLDRFGDGEDVVQKVRVQPGLELCVYFGIVEDVGVGGREAFVEGPEFGSEEIASAVDAAEVEGEQGGHFDIGGGGGDGVEGGPAGGGNAGGVEARDGGEVDAWGPVIVEFVGGEAGEITTDEGEGGAAVEDGRVGGFAEIGIEDEVVDEEGAQHAEEAGGGLGGIGVAEAVCGLAEAAAGGVDHGPPGQVGVDLGAEVEGEGPAAEAAVADRHGRGQELVPGLGRGGSDRGEHGLVGGEHDGVGVEGQADEVAVDFDGTAGGREEPGGHVVEGGNAGERSEHAVRPPEASLALAREDDVGGLAAQNYGLGVGAVVVQELVKFDSYVGV